MPCSQAPAVPVGAALRSHALAELESAMSALDRGGTHLHAGVHQARKAVRRTRSVLALGGAVLGPGSAVIDRELRRVNRGMSTLRDAHALVETLDRLASQPRGQAVLRALGRARRIAAARRAVLARDPHRAANLADTRAMLRMLRAALEGLSWDAMTSATLHDALAMSSRRARSAGERACSNDSHDDNWHRWRRRMRRVSQQHRACTAAGLATGDSMCDQSVFDKSMLGTSMPGTSMLDKSMAEQLGRLQDLTLLLDHCGPGSPFAKADRVALRQFAKDEQSRQRLRIAAVASLSGQPSSA